MASPYDLATIRACFAGRACPSEDVGAAGRRAAVAAVLREPAPGRSAELLFIRRAEHPQDPWSGHMAFPGGRCDEGDADPVATAVRETLEEVGLDLRACATLVGRLAPRQAIARGRTTGLTIDPFVFALAVPEVPLVPNHEVAETLWVPLAALACGDGAGTFPYEHQGRVIELPCIHLGRHVLWGLTYQMVQDVLRALREGQAGAAQQA